MDIITPHGNDSMNLVTLFLTVKLLTNQITSKNALLNFIKQYKIGNAVRQSAKYQKNCEINLQV